MRPRPPIKGRGIFSGTGLVITGLAATIAALLFPLWSYADRQDVAGANVLSAHTVTTPYGPLSAQDRDFVTKVRLAGLWELPAGQLAQRKGTTPAVRTAGQHLVDGHTSLDGHVRTVATQLGVSLPNEPNDQQKEWLATLESAQGQDFDRRFAGILRLAHGRVFSLVAQIRAGTQNSLVRDLADDANATVLDHIKVLEATGYVDFAALARELAASATPVPAPPVVDPSAAVPVVPSSSPSPSSSPGETYTLPPAATSPPPQPSST
jgi:predicted outer membrane protein